MATIGVTSEELHAQHTQVLDGAQRVADILNSLSGQMSGLAGAWHGPAATRFQERWQEWNTSAGQVQQAMENMGRFLLQAAEAYETNEQNLSAASGS